MFLPVLKISFSYVWMFDLHVCTYYECGYENPAFIKMRCFNRAALEKIILKSCHWVLILSYNQGFSTNKSI